MNTTRHPLARIAAVTAALALVSVPSAASNFADGDAEAGAEKITTCAACHGGNGISVNPQWPSLAGQHSRYSMQQLMWFKSGERKNILMNSQAMALSEQDMRDIAAYFESLAPAVREVANPDTLARGERLYRGGDEERGLPACIACHGPSGAGNPGVPYPKLGGQHATYLASSLREYATGGENRSNTEEQKQMTTIAQKLTPEDIEALSSYMQGLN
ncbi:MAG: c-type cytochrome [Pseudomonadota bacterium]